MINDFESLGLKSGVWQGVLKREKAPGRLNLVHLGARVGEARATAQGRGQWRTATAIPAECLSDGAQTFMLLEDGGTGAEAVQGAALHLGSLTLVAGEILAEDFRTEMHLIRSELDLLKKELRRLASVKGD